MATHATSIDMEIDTRNEVVEESEIEVTATSNLRGDLAMETAASGKMLISSENTTGRNFYHGGDLEVPQP